MEWYTVIVFRTLMRPQIQQYDGRHFDEHMVRKNAKNLGKDSNTVLIVRQDGEGKIDFLS